MKFQNLYLMHFLLTTYLRSYLAAYLLMPSDKHMQCLYHGATFEPLCASITSSQMCSYRWQLQFAHNGFSTRHKYHWDTLYSYNVKKWVLNCLNRGVIYGFHASRYGYAHHKWIFHNVFSVMARWIAEVLFMLFYAYAAV